MNLAITPYSFGVIFGSSAAAKEQTLDSRFAEIKQFGSLYSFCMSNKEVEECRVGIGEWNPEELERVKSLTIQCFDQCPPNTFGFVRDPNGNREYPEVSTKDFDGWSPSRGVEFKLYPMTISILRYEGCAGCGLVKETPSTAVFELNNSSVQLPMLGYGAFYLPRAARTLAMTAAQQSLPLRVTLTFSKSKENRLISTEAVKEYLKMMKALNYFKLK